MLRIHPRDSLQRLAYPRRRERQRETLDDGDEPEPEERRLDQSPAHPFGSAAALADGAGVAPGSGTTARGSGEWR